MGRPCRMMNQKIVAKALGGATYYEEGYINYKYKAFYGREAAKRKELFPTWLQSTMDEQHDEGEGEDVEAAEDEDLDPTEDEYFEASVDEYPDPALRRDIEDTESEFLDPVEPGPSTSTAQPASGTARSTYWTWEWTIEGFGTREIDRKDWACDDFSLGCDDFGVR